MLLSLQTARAGRVAIRHGDASPSCDRLRAAAFAHARSLRAQGGRAASRVGGGAR
jgi:hypothetical protein